ncbi:hypothetical protein LCI18_013095 [Fusarium solani-melongenae]|uniref:Uncharacterized protein n=1 Tax=Fusarium solani subsp. cucurbitae TaxID=2747967 RepID=A0ACD3ZM38_FUSSC|nr:hypothetical protein LCI18_013095 [Fusarium solani-melongenae]
MRARFNIMDQAGSEDAGPAPQNERSRADKKRHTDRVAQQRHRQRQRNYIAQLEAQLLLLKEGSSGQITQLVEENAQLRQELDRTNALLDDLAEVLGRRRTQGSVLAGTGRKPLVDLSKQVCQSEKEVATSDSESPAADQMLGSRSARSELLLTFATSTRQSPAEDEVMTGSTNDPQTQQRALALNVACAALPCLISPVPPGQAAPDTGAHSLPERITSLLSQQPTNEVNAPPSMFTLVPEQRQAESLAPDRIPFDLLDSGGGHQWAPFWDSPPPWILSLQTSMPTHWSTSKVIVPPPPCDYQLHQILNAARAHVCDIGSPTIADFLLDESPNPLSRQLKLYKDPLKKKNKPFEFFASYWILYLFFRVSRYL